MAQLILRMDVARHSLFRIARIKTSDLADGVLQIRALALCEAR